MTSKLYAQSMNKIPYVLDMPKDLDRTTVYVWDKLSALEKNRLSSSKSIPEQIRTNLGLDKAKLGEQDIQFLKAIDYGSFTLQHLLFQSVAGVYVPAHLYIPKGEGPFPAVINSHGHWPDGKSGQIVQQTAQLFAKNGYVCLNIDAWGAGERGSNHKHEYHGASLGSALLDLGIPLMGMQLLDNQRAIDLLQSLPYVNKTQIGATGASGGGNQTLWLTALDKRIAAAVPVVSIGTFQAYILNSNCVCELHPAGLLHFEKSDLIASMQPRAVKILSALRDGNAAFNVYEMLKTYNAATVQYEKAGVKDNLAYEIFDVQHDYTAEMQLEALFWFNKHFKMANKQIDTLFQEVPMQDLQVLDSPDKRKSVATTLTYLHRQAQEMEDSILSTGQLDRTIKLNALRDKLNYTLPNMPTATALPAAEAYERIVLSSNSGQLIPLIIFPSSQPPSQVKVVFNAEGNSAVSSAQLSDWQNQGQTVILVDLLGLGERSSLKGDHIDGQLPRFHTLSRSFTWMGENIMATWLSEMSIALSYLAERYSGQEKVVVANRETAIAALLHNVLNENKYQYLLQDLPYSYVPDYADNATKGKQAINMGVHIPGIIEWGDVLLLMGLSQAPLQVDGLLGMSGVEISGLGKQEFIQKVKQLRSKLNASSEIHFN